MSTMADLRVLYRLAVAPVRGRTHAERMESFYGVQANDYDSFRERLLPGRQYLCEQLPLREGAVWVDLGGGTGANLEFVRDWIPRLAKVYVVDLSSSLLEVARERSEKYGWSNVETVVADATRFEPPESADIVTCSYSLTMIPDWFAAIEHANRFLKPGGTFGAVDFYVSRKHPEPGYERHSWFTRTLWPTWFAFDNVHLSPDHVRFLHRTFQCQRFLESRTRLPYVPFVRAPWYSFLGRKREE